MENFKIIEGKMFVIFNEQTQEISLESAEFYDYEKGIETLFSVSDTEADQAFVNTELGLLACRLAEKPLQKYSAEEIRAILLLLLHRNKNVPASIVLDEAMNNINLVRSVADLQKTRVHQVWAVIDTMYRYLDDLRETTASDIPELVEDIADSLAKLKSVAL